MTRDCRRCGRPICPIFRPPISIPPNSIRCAMRASFYADLLRQSGIPVRYTCHEGMIHHFYGMAGVIPYARTAMSAAGAAIKSALA